MERRHRVVVVGAGFGGLAFRLVDLQVVRHDELRALARAMMVRLDWPLEDTHGFALDASEALKLARLFARRGQALKPVFTMLGKRLPFATAATCAVNLAAGVLGEPPQDPAGPGD